jgi:PPIC-type PPIASE domain/SurA N-terminal domain
MFQGRGGGVFVTVCAVVATACASTATGPTKPSPVIARVAADTITLAEFDVRYQSTIIAIQQAGGPVENAAQTTDLRASILRSLILDTVIREEATKLGLAATTQQIQAQVAVDAQQAGGISALTTALAGAGGSIAQLDDEISSEINEQRLEDNFAQTRAAMVEQSLASGANFIATAKTFSDDTGTSAKGGNLGVLTSADLSSYDAAFSAAVKALKVGDYTKTPVHDAGGYDILKLNAVSTKGWTVSHVLIAAPTPYSVMDRPAWFTESLFTALAQLCKASQISVTLTNAGGNPCDTPAPTPSPSPSKAGLRPSPNA